MSARTTAARIPTTAPSARLSTKAAGRRFARDGFVLVPGLVRGAQLAELQRDFDRIVAQLQGGGEPINARWSSPENDRLDGGGTVVIHTHEVQGYSAAWSRFLFHRRLLDLAAVCLGCEDIVLHHTKLFQKPAERGAAFPPHQDWGYFPVRNDRMIAAIVHLSAADDAMGCVRMWPGSHRHGRIGDSKGAGPEFALRFPVEESVACTASPGDVLFFHYHTVHASLPNRSERVRKTVLLQLLAGDEVLEAPEQHAFSKLVLRGWNHTMTRTLAGS